VTRLLDGCHQLERSAMQHTREAAKATSMRRSGSVAKVLAFSRQRIETQRWTAFRSHYDLDVFHCRPGGARRSDPWTPRSAQPRHVPPSPVDHEVGDPSHRRFTTLGP
jgi:hypothetical protein